MVLIFFLGGKGRRGNDDLQIFIQSIMIRIST
jgi:hypothetical protein